jgi:hypothetical protein
MATRAAVLLFLSSVFASCENHVSNTSMINNYSDPYGHFRLVYSGTGKLDSVHCSGNSTRTGNLGTLDFTNSETVHIRLNYEVKNSSISSLVLYYRDNNNNPIQFARFDTYDYEGIYYHEFFVSSPNIKKNVRYEMNVDGNGGGCYFVVRNMKISKD